MTAPRKKNRQNGFTLIETLIYSLLISFILSTSLMAVYQILTNSTSLANKTIAEQEAALIMTKMNWALNDLASVNPVVLPAVNSSGSALEVNKNGYPLITLDSSGGNFRIQRGAGTPVIINSSRITIASLSFEYTRVTGTIQTNTITGTFYIGKNKYQLTHLLH